MPCRDNFTQSTDLTCRLHSRILQLAKNTRSNRVCAPASEMAVFGLARQVWEHKRQRSVYACQHRVRKLSWPPQNVPPVGDLSPSKDIYPRSVLRLKWYEPAHAQQIVRCCSELEQPVHSPQSGTLLPGRVVPASSNQRMLGSPWLRTSIPERGLTWNQLAARMGVSVATLAHLSVGGRTSFPQVMRILIWLERSAAEFTRLTDR
jgi:hypothetical protein